MNILVVSTNKNHLEEFNAMLSATRERYSVTAIAGSLDTVPQETGAEAPDVLILDSAGDVQKDLQGLERLGHIYPTTAFVLVCERQSPEFLLPAMRAGVREVLAKPVSKETLHAALNRIGARIAPRGHRTGTVMAFISCKGGSGATFLATNLGYTLAEQEKKKVLLIDLNLQFGDAAMFVSDHRPATTLADVAMQIQRVDAAFLAASVVNVLPNYGVLAAPDDPAHKLEVKPEHIDFLIHLARSHYDFVVLDIGRSLDPVSIRALDHADIIFPVLQLTLPFVRDGKRLLDVFRSLDYRADKIRFVINRYEKGSDLRLADLERTLGRKVFRTIPNNYEVVAASVNQGVPVLRLNRHSSIAKSLREFATELSAVHAGERKGWLSRLLGH